MLLLLLSFYGVYDDVYGGAYDDCCWYLFQLLLPYSLDFSLLPFEVKPFPLHPRVIKKVDID